MTAVLALLILAVTACQNENSDKSEKEAVSSAFQSQNTKKDSSAATQAAIPATVTKESPDLPTKITVRHPCSCGGSPTKQYHRCIDPDEMAYFVRKSQNPFKCPGEGGCSKGSHIVYQLCDDAEANLPMQKKLTLLGDFPGTCYGTYPECTNFTYDTIPVVSTRGRKARGWQNGGAVKIGDETFRIRCIQLAHSETCKNPHSGGPITVQPVDLIILDRLPVTRIESGDVIEYLGERQDPVPPPIAMPERDTDSLPATSRARLLGSLPAHCVGKYPNCSNLSKHAVPYIHVRRTTKETTWLKGATLTIGGESFKIECTQSPTSEACTNPISGKPLTGSPGSELILLDHWPKKRLYGGLEILYNP